MLAKSSFSRPAMVLIVDARPLSLSAPLELCKPQTDVEKNTFAFALWRDGRRAKNHPFSAVVEAKAVGCFASLVALLSDTSIWI